MLFAVNATNVRVQPSYSGQKAKCPLCDGDVIGNCGEIYANHWKHAHDRECDPWQEHETPWHRKWKGQFPKEWREVVIEKGQEKHFADIQTSEGIVIEFQNSSIAKSTIRIRENFYQDMVWVINAISFRNNFHHIKSLVTSMIRNIESEAAFDLSFLENGYTETLKELEIDLEKKQKEIKTNFDAINAKNLIITKVNEAIENIAVVATNIVEKWSEGSSYWENILSRIVNKIEGELRDNLHGIIKQIRLLESEKNENKQNLLIIQNLESVHIDSKLFKIVNYATLNPRNFHKARAILKENRKNLFPEFIPIRTETEYQIYGYKSTQFDFAIDPTDAINYSQNKISEIDKMITPLEETFQSLKIEIKSKLHELLFCTAKEIEKEMDQLNYDGDELIKEKSVLRQRQAEVVAAKEKDLKESEKLIEWQKNEKKFKAMREKKGVYTFEWKHERKSWKDAECPIYFDIGEEYLFEKLGKSSFRKILITDFLEKYLTIIS